MKCDNVITWDVFAWNWAESSTYDLICFGGIMYCETIANEICWLEEENRGF